MRDRGETEDTYKEDKLNRGIECLTSQANNHKKLG